MTPKVFIIYLISAFVLGFAIMFSFHIINKPIKETEIENKEVIQLKHEKDSLINYAHSRNEVVTQLKRQLTIKENKYDSVINNNHSNGKIKKNVLLNSHGNSVNRWNDSVLSANNAK